MSGGGKGSSTQTMEVKLPPFLEKAAKENIAMADEVGRLGFMPNLGPTVAGFSPGQRAAMDNTNQAAQAFGMQQAGDVDEYMMGESFNGGAAYGGAPVYEQMLAGLTPEQRESILSFVGGGGRSVTDQQGGSKGAALGFNRPGGMRDFMEGQISDRTSGNKGGNNSWGSGDTMMASGGRGPSSYQDTYDRQMSQYTSNPGISVGYGNTASSASSSARSGGSK